MDHVTIILFGGTFDPIHNGHLKVGHTAVEQCQAERLIFVPARRSPHKTETLAAGHHRLEMIHRATVGCDRFEVSDCELARRDPSYTLDTVRYFQQMFGLGADLIWLVGTDQLGALDRWYKVDELLDACRIAVMHRAGYPPPNFERFEGIFTDTQIAVLKQNVIQTPLIDISSTDIRRRLASGDHCTDVLPETVVYYIQANHLYDFRA